MSPDAQPSPGRGRRTQDSRGGRSSGAHRTSGYTPGPPDPEYDEQAIDAEGYESDPLTADAWAATCMALDRGELDIEDVDFPAGDAPLTAIRSSRGGWRTLG